MNISPREISNAPIIPALTPMPVIISIYPRYIFYVNVQHKAKIAQDTQIRKFSEACLLISKQLTFIPEKVTKSGRGYQQKHQFHELRPIALSPNLRWLIAEPPLAYRRTSVGLLPNLRCLIAESPLAYYSNADKPKSSLPIPSLSVRQIDYLDNPLAELI